MTHVFMSYVIVTWQESRVETVFITAIICRLLFSLNHIMQSSLYDVIIKTKTGDTD